MTDINPGQALDRIIEVMARLRDPVNGCPWDLQQTWHSLVPYTLEEAYEVADAIETLDKESLPNELGDLLFQVVFYSRIAEEQNLFDLQQVIHQLCDKLEQRHPHVFTDKNASDKNATDLTSGQLEQAWHNAKVNERKEKQQHSAVDDIPLSLPALSRAQKLQRRAANEGFDWRHHDAVFEKVDEEMLELKQALAEGDPLKIQDEMGDLLFTVVNLSRHLNLDAESCLRQASRKFEKRFRAVESYYQQQNQKISDIPDDELEATWQQVKLNNE